MDVLVIGGGGREHAIIKKLRESAGIGEISCAPGNGGISADARCFPVNAMDFTGILELARELKPGLVVIGPDDPLCGGLADMLKAAGFTVFGPDKAAAAIEGSKVFSKSLMRKYDIPTARYGAFFDYESAEFYIDSCDRFPVAVKADGLALGKGVVIAQDKKEALEAVKSMLLDGAFGEAGKKIVIEEFLTGVEISVLAFCDGKSIRPMVSAKDHKAIFDGDRGPNTGGMGAIAPHPCYNAQVEREFEEKIMLPTLRALCSEGIDFRGVIFFGMILTKDGLQLFEYNARFGDPETQVVLPLLEGDLLEIMLAVANQRLESVTFGIKDGAACNIVLASGGYPGKYPSGLEIFGLEDCGCTVYHSGTRLEDGRFYTAGGRVLGVCALKRSLEEAISAAYDGAKAISFEGMYSRGDIGVIYDTGISG